MEAQRMSVYEMVRNRIIASLEENTVPWRRTWQSMSPINVITGKPYRGINRILLSGHSHWGTFKQIKKAGGYVRKGEHASGMVVYWSFDEEITETDENTGETVTVIVKRDRPLVRYYPVFNLSQCEGIELENGNNIQPIADCEDIISRNNPRLRVGDPAYEPTMDVIFMPDMSAFEGVAHYYSSFYHELTHWSGHESRLNRAGITEPIKFGSERYSREELTAEMGAAFLCAMTGIDMPVLENQKAYIAGWLKHIQNGSAVDVVRAAGDAERAANWLTGMKNGK